MKRWLYMMLVLLALIMGLSPVATVLAQQGGNSQANVEALMQAFEAQKMVTRLLGDPGLGQDVQAIRNAVQQAMPHAQTVQTQLQAAFDQASNQPKDFLQMALQEQQSAVQLSQEILNGPDDKVVLRHQELVTHGSVELGLLNLALSMLGAGPSAPGSVPPLEASALEAPNDYLVEIVANGLTFPAAVAVAPDGAIYVAEAGYAYGNVTAPARVLRVGADGTTQVAFNQGFTGPIAGLAVHDGQLYVSHRGTISRIDLATGAKTDIITDLPSGGDHFNENIAVGPDNKLYITQGTVTNSGVVGLDSYFFGWLPQNPQLSEIPCRDLTLVGLNYPSGNPLTPEVTDEVSTGVYLPFGTPSTAGQVVKGQVKCTGAILRANLDGSGLEVFADGFRNPYGLAFQPDGRLFVTENGPDDRGSRPVAGPDNFYEVVQGGWYGWPDFYGGVPVNDPSRKPEVHELSQPVLSNPPPLARQPLAQLPNHAAATGFDFSRSADFAPVGQAFIAQFGTMAPPTAGGLETTEATGFNVVMVTPQGEVQPFLSATSPEGVPLLRPTDVTFDPSGQIMYVTHFGAMAAIPGGIAPTPGTGALLRLTRAETLLPQTGATDTGAAEAGTDQAGLTQPGAAQVAPPANLPTTGENLAPAAQGNTPVAVTLVDGQLQMPNSIPAGSTTFNITNNGTTEHSFEIEGNGIEEELDPHLQPGQNGTLTVDLQPGTYEVYCPVGNHRAEGMTMQLTVTAATEPAQQPAQAQPPALPGTGGVHLPWSGLLLVGLGLVVLMGGLTLALIQRIH